VKKRTLVLSGFLLVAGLAAMGQSEAQTTGQPAAAANAGKVPTKVGVMAAQSALLSTHDGQRALQEMNKQLEPTKATLDKKAQGIRELQDKLQRGGNAMADAAKAELQRTIESQTKAYNRDMEDAQAETQAEERKMLEELSGKMQVVIEKYAQANAYTVLLDVSNQNTNVIWISTAIDVTKDVIDLYDKMNPGGPTTKPTSMPLNKPTAPATPPTSAPVVPKKQP
jgi:Skp family chaperone for outer membrane proteins